MDTLAPEPSREVEEDHLMPFQLGQILQGILTVYSIHAEWGGGSWLAWFV